jgi:hypothetical protein
MVRELTAAHSRTVKHAITKEPTAISVPTDKPSSPSRPVMSPVEGLSWVDGLQRGSVDATAGAPSTSARSTRAPRCAA